MKSCLLVDGSRVIRKVARQIFESMHFKCDEAENGQLALDAARVSLPDLVLLDFHMPVMDGVEFVRALRQLPGADRSKVIFCTTENSLKEIQVALEAGADEYIMKPFDADIIRGKLEQLDLLES